MPLNSGRSGNAATARVWPAAVAFSGEQGSQLVPPAGPCCRCPQRRRGELTALWFVLTLSWLANAAVDR
ncbi:MAG TPA: hypothetical protein ENK23_01350 [Sorangium sp.]|nr:hypothetical protein [Sorangium sp.]